MNDTQNLGNFVKQQRNRIGLSLVDLAAKSGVSTSHLSRIEKAQRYPSANILRKIAKPLRFNEGELFTFAGYLSQPSVESEAQLGRLDPYVARTLAQEPVDVQRTVIGILTILKSIAKSVKK